MNEGGGARVKDMSAKNKSGSSDEVFLGGGGGSDTNRKHLRHQRDLLMHIKSMRDLHPELLDVTFVVGFEGEEKCEIRANSTVLSLKSDYFKTM